MARMRQWLAEAWDLVGADFPLFSVAAFLTVTLSAFSFFILALPLTVGLGIMFIEKMHGRQPQLSQLWEGLTSHFPAAIVIWILVMAAAIPFDLLNYYLRSQPAPWPALGILSVGLGLWLIGAPLFFTLPLIADRDLSARDAIQLSWAQVRPRWPRILLYLALCGLTLLFGVFACGVGLIITLPLAVGAQMLAYRDLVGNFAAPQMTSLREDDAMPVEEDATDETQSPDSHGADAGAHGGPGG